MRKLIVLLLATTSFCLGHAQIIGLPAEPAGISEVPACPDAQTLALRTNPVPINAAGVLLDGSVVYFCINPGANMAKMSASNRFVLDYVTGKAAYGTDMGEHIAFTLYIDGAILPLIATRVGNGEYALAQKMPWLIDVRSALASDFSKRSPADPHVFIDLRQQNASVSPKKGSNLYLVGHYE